MELISYKPLWKTLVEKEMKKTDLLDVVGISRGTLTKLSKNEPVSVKIIDRICEKLEIEVTDVVEYVKSE
jgi:DNA-binding Xre family transcriptional regulator